MHTNRSEEYAALGRGDKVIGLPGILWSEHWGREKARFDSAAQPCGGLLKMPFLLLGPNLGFPLVLIAAIPSKYGAVPTSAHTADLLS